MQNRQVAPAYTGGLPETHCGYGSTLRATVSARNWLADIIDRYHVKTFLDAPCGDLNWLRHMTWDGVQYIGIDQYEPNLWAAKELGFDVRVADIITNRLPDADMLLCRDFLQHLTMLEILRFFSNIKRSKIIWLVATSHGNAENTELPDSGFRPFNLLIPPLSLPCPAENVEDCGRTLGLWRL